MYYRMHNIRIYECHKCGTNTKINLCENEENLYYFFCGDCLKKINVCSKRNCHKLFLLTNEMKNTKNIYLSNNNNKFYLYDDIEQILISKYGSINELKK
jgi:hypothetical protein